MIVAARLKSTTVILHIAAVVMDRDEEDQHSLVEGVRAGDSQAVERLIARLKEKLPVYVRNKIGLKLLARIDVEDVVQQTLCEIYFLIRDSDRPIKNLDLLAKAIARNVVCAYARSRSIHFASLEIGRDNRQLDGAKNRLGKRSDSDSGILRAERRELVQKAVSSLTPEQARIVELRFFNETGIKLKFSDIAKRMGKNPQATEKAYLRAKKRIRDFIEKHLRISKDRL